MNGYRKRHLRPLLGAAAMMFASPSLLLPARPAVAAPAWQDHVVGQVMLLDAGGKSDRRLLPYRQLVAIRAGEKYRYPLVRQSLDNLNRTGAFSGIEVRVQPRSKLELDVLFILQKKPLIRSLKFNGMPEINHRELRAALYSLKRNELLDESRLAKAQEELQILFKSKGYFNASASARINLDQDGSSCVIDFDIIPGRPAQINRLLVETDDPQLAAAVRDCFRAKGIYRPGEFTKGSEKARRLLKKHLYHFPEIRIKEEFVDPERSLLDITITVACGFRYHFIFQGMAPRLTLIADVWERRVFEKWAEEESRARLLNFLKNEGYLDARVTVAITTSGQDKTIIFKVEKNRRYRLGRITIHGNRAVDTGKIRQIMRTDDVPFHKLAWLRLNSLVADMEVLKLYYYYQGISPIEIRLEPSFQGSRADVGLVIDEGRKHRMTSVEFNGNHAFGSAELYRLIKSRVGSPYVPKQLGEDIDRLRNFYRDNGYDEATVNYELSAGEDKSLMIVISEKRQKRMGELIILGASSSQRQLLKKLFPLTKGNPFSRNRIEAFRTEVENGALFSAVSVEPLTRDPETIDVLVKVIPDRSRLYGLGLGWKERRGSRGPRGTVEYQEKNLFNSIYSLATILQAGVNVRDGELIVDESRGILSFDAPYLFRNKVTSSFKIWDENETYPSYRFIRWGLGATFAKKFSDKLYMLGSAKWYRTSLTELKIPPFGVDQLKKPFNTTALSLSFIDEERDDPFNPQQGRFLNADLKLGLPVFEKDYTFLKLYWNYQKHYPFLRDGAISFSVKNGIAFGDMSITERFFAGGAHSFRGAGNDRLGPINLAGGGEGNLPGEPEGGNVLLLLNLEATVPGLFIPIKNLYYTFFADAGNVFSKSSDFNLRKMERALGFGLKYRTPLGPIRLDFAFNLRRTAEKNFLVFIGIGNVY